MAKYGNRHKSLSVFAAACLLPGWGVVQVAAQEKEEAAVVLDNKDASKFAQAPGLMPPCFQGAMQRIIPATGGAVFLVKAAESGCDVPWHWHSSGEQITVVSGEVQIAMRGERAITLKAGGYAYMPAHHIHSFRCAGPCQHFVQSDGLYDIHFVNGQDTEISMAEALKR